MPDFFKGSGDPQQLQQGWDILAEQVSLPVAVLRQDALQQNAHWMAQFAQQNNVLLAPHGKTTMSPELFKYQQGMGAWAITVATVPQLICAVEAGIKRVILANQLVGRYHFELVANLLKSAPLELFCFVDSIDNVHALGDFFNQQEVKVNLLLEIGVVGGRCGVRNFAELTSLIKACHAYPSLQIVGLGFYEGIIGGEHAEQDVERFVESVIMYAEQLHQQGMFACSEPIVSGAGSAWYDVVTKVMKHSAHTCEFKFVIRPGCYLIHDTGIYHNAQQAILKRSEAACGIEGELVSSLFIWAYVTSLPEPGFAIVGMGKRDVAFDAGLPKPEYHYGTYCKRLQSLNSDFYTEKIMDQHAMLRLPPNHLLKVGDMICFSTSHPCLTFDKWKHIGIVERDWVITKTITTHF
ncbi:amino acid deaminase [Pseudoalteromonas sp. JBTF-M23]|uniref:Amino acid deaminase n=1 Tax=Pseudoalteromonas caenipelagi TaxID=2726988 RepID=A0A849VDL5_9GAMM|nr:amino acid deaminase [Pseudoalteromonas caenipelagi]NOU50888.1 amino acid deaminase [Pseudoalteromonas caenipelagi]